MAWYYRRPFLGYMLLFVLTAYTGVVPRSGEEAVVSALVLPWLVLLLILVNLPFVRGLVRRLRLSEPERRNHALEHGTIHFLCGRYGTSRGLGGRALKHGFRVSGARDPEDIRRAFVDLLALPREQRWRVVVSDKCGSMIVVAQGVGVIQLVLVMVLFLLMSPSRTAVAIVLATQLALFLALRHPLGFLIQRRRLLSLSFEEARILRIKNVHAELLFERPPVYLVETMVRT